MFKVTLILFYVHKDKAFVDILKENREKLYVETENNCLPLCRFING